MVLYDRKAKREKSLKAHSQFLWGKPIGGNNVRSVQSIRVSPNATDDEIKTAYRELAKKYHPDNYAESPLADLASEKMKEINEAYDTIMNDRKARANNGGYQQNGYGGYQGGYQSGASYGRSTEYSDVRNLLMNGRIADAEQILDGVPAGRRGGEWYFLKGTCLYKRMDGGSLQQFLHRL